MIVYLDNLVIYNTFVIMASHALHLIISAVGIVIGCLGFVVFKYQYDDENNSNWSLVSVCIATLVMFVRLHLMYFPATSVNIEDPPSTVQGYLHLISLYGVCSAVIGLTFGLEGTMRYFQRSLYITSALSLFLVVWSLMLLWTSFSFKHISDRIEALWDSFKNRSCIQYLGDIENQQTLTQDNTLYYYTFDNDVCKIKET